MLFLNLALLLSLLKKKSSRFNYVTCTSTVPYVTAIRYCIYLLITAGGMY